MMHIRHTNDEAMTEQFQSGKLCKYLCGVVLKQVMIYRNRQELDRFRVVGINYKKSDASVRGSFAINTTQYDCLLSNAADFGLKDLFVLSTCNRTEIYGSSESAQQFANLICSVCPGDINTFLDISYIKNGLDAIGHLYEVAAGLDSQILGDYEILGQIKNAVKHARMHGFIGAFTDRIVNSVIQASKAIKTNTGLSGGTISVSFAAIQYIKQFFGTDTASNDAVTNATGGLATISEKKIMLLGTGKIGRSTCHNMIDYLQTKNITLINRTDETAATLAREVGVRSASSKCLNTELAIADILVIATNSPTPVITKEHLDGKGNKLIIDLSVPSNVTPEAQKMPGITYVDVDMLSKIKDETLLSRRAELPKAIAIIQDHISLLMDWYEMRKNVPVLQEVKNTLRSIYIDPSLLQPDYFVEQTPQVVDVKIQKVINSMASKMRQCHAPGCHYIEAINDFIE